MEAVISVGDAAEVVIALCSIASLYIGLHNKGQIEKVEKATNSMKDALVAGAGREGITEGLRQAAEAVSTSSTAV
jgi:hypothetical protein